MKQLLKQIIYEQRLPIETEYIVRDFPESLVKSKEIVIISGIRRCGKSVLLKQIQKLNAEGDFYINFDDERLIKFAVDDFQLLHEVFIELFGVQNTFYFDEIQNIYGWERFVRRLYDAGGKIYITGSNATMLSRELGTHLTGRYVAFELYPFSFKEYLRYIKLDFTPDNFYTTKGRALFRKAFEAYFINGGFPQYLTNKSVDYLKSLYESILYRDVLVRNKLTNEREILELLYYLASNVSKLSSNNALKGIIGISSGTTIKNYLEYIANTYLIFQVSKYDYSLKKQIHNPKKTYFIDNALVIKLGFSFSENNGRLLENLIALQLKRNGEDIYYHNSTHECDFLIRRNTRITGAIQVCFDMSAERALSREMAGLTNVMNHFGLTEGIIITMDEEKDVEVKPQGIIKLIPAWKWLLGVGR